MLDRLEIKGMRGILITAFPRYKIDLLSRYKLVVIAAIFGSYSGGAVLSKTRVKGNRRQKRDLYAL